MLPFVTNGFDKAHVGYTTIILAFILAVSREAPGVHHARPIRLRLIQPLYPSHHGPHLSRGIRPSVLSLSAHNVTPYPHNQILRNDVNLCPVLQEQLALDVTMHAA